MVYTVGCTCNCIAFLLRTVPTSHTQAAGKGSPLKRFHLHDPETSEWRFGPAKVWYDMMGVPEDGQGLSYGYKVKVRPHSFSMCMVCVCVCVCVFVGNVQLGTISFICR